MPTTLPEPYASIREIDPISFRAFSADGEFLLDMDADGARGFIEAGHAKWRPTPTPRLETVRFVVTEPVYTSAGLAPTQLDGHHIRAGDLILLTGQPKAAQKLMKTMRAVMRYTACRSAETRLTSVCSRPARK